MDNFKKGSCLIISEVELFQRIKALLQSEYYIHRTRNLNTAIFTICQKFVSCIIAHVNNHHDAKPEKLATIKTNFPTIPIICIYDGRNTELAWAYGKAGIDCFITECGMNDLYSAIQNTIFKNGFIVNWQDIGIDTDCNMPMIKNALKILQEEYLKFNSIQELAQELDISAEVLSRTFKKHLNIGPKRILMHLKTQYAIHLMQNPGLSLKEIARLSSFTDKYHFNRCFRSMTGLSPNQFRIGKLYPNQKDNLLRMVKK